MQISSGPDKRTKEYRVACLTGIKANKNIERIELTCIKRL